MSLVKCAECGKEVSDRAVSCPNCGLPQQQPLSTPDKRRRLVGIGISLTFLGLIGMLLSSFLPGGCIIPATAVVLGPCIALFGFTTSRAKPGP